MHEAAVGVSIGVDEIAEAGGAGVGEVGAAAERAANAVVAGVRVDVEFRRPVAAGTTGSAIIGRAEEELFSGVLAGGEVWERLAFVSDRAAGIVFAVEGLQAADELGDCFADAFFIDLASPKTPWKSTWYSSMAESFVTRSLKSGSPSVPLKPIST